MYYRKTAIFLIALILLFSTIAVPSYAESVSVILGGKAVSYTDDSGTPFIDTAGRTQTPFRRTLEEFGATVAWEAENKTASATIYGITVEIPVGQKYILRNGEPIAIDTVAQIKEGRVYLPIRAVLEAFGAAVAWDTTTQSILVTAANASTVTTEGALTVHFINVGQGDSIFLDYGDYEILIDAGPAAQAAKVVNYIVPYVNGALDLVVATHEHEDHIGGMPAVFAIFQVDRVIDNGRKIDTAYYEEYLDAVTAEPDCAYPAATAGAIEIGEDAHFRILPITGVYETPNENSVVSLLEYKEVRMLFMGDLETSAEKNNLSVFQDIDVLKVGHHGSRTATSQELLDVIKPETAVISAGINNDFILPNAAVIERLRLSGATVYGTFRSGDIVLTTDGEACSFNTEILLTTDDAGAFGSLEDAAATEIKLSEGFIDPANYVTAQEAVYVGNAETKKFHTLECEAGAKIADRRAVYFKTREAAIAEGYTPCKLCNP